MTYGVLVLAILFFFLVLCEEEEENWEDRQLRKYHIKKRGED